MAISKGQRAKEAVEKKIIEAFGADYAGTYDKKVYLWADDGGQRIQVALSMTCPKVFRGTEETLPTELNFEDMSAAPAAAPKQVEVTPEETETLQELMNRLGL